MSKFYCSTLEGATCGRFIPRARYFYIPNAKNEPISIWLPQRFHFAPSQRAKGGSGYVADNPLLPVPVLGAISDTYAITIPVGSNPTDKEVMHTVIDNGKAVSVFTLGQTVFNWWASPGFVDNYHQTCMPGPVDQPRAIPARGGCPDCIHTHWRWGSNIKLSGVPPKVPDFFWPTTGQPDDPLIPKGSPQQVRLATVRDHPDRPEEADPEDFRLLVDGEEVAHIDYGIVSNGYGPFQAKQFWYQGMSTAKNDSFYNHGLFFMTQAPDCNSVPLSGSGFAFGGADPVDQETASCGVVRRPGRGVLAELAFALVAVASVVLRRRRREQT